MKKLNNKGFTLIEIVIVIVIIAILAAMLVPSLTSWIDKSKQKTFTSACGTIRTAVSAAVSEAYATNSTVNTISAADSDGAKVTADVGKKVTLGTIANCTGFELQNGGVYTINSDANANSLYVTDGKFCGQWNGTDWTITKKS